MKLHKESHLDHGLSAAHLAFVLLHFAHRTEAFKETLELPPELADLRCALRGPIVGDHPIEDWQVEMYRRGDRKYLSRGILWLSLPTRLITVIAGPHHGHPCVLHTAFGGPLSPREVNDPYLTDAERPESDAFWGVHAIAYGDDV